METIIIPTNTPSAMQWVGQNLSLGGILRHSGRGLGSIVKFAFMGVGAVVSQLPKDSSGKERVKRDFDSAGQTIDTALTKGGEVVGNGVNRAIQAVSTKVGEAAGGLARKTGASEETIIITQKIGKVVGAATIGFVAGVGLADVAVALAAASGTAGAAATASGLAALGGGSIAAGGGGMAAGHVVTEFITSASAFSGTAALRDKDHDQQKVDQIQSHRLATT